jgi:hypothetical protein
MKIVMREASTRERYSLQRKIGYTWRTSIVIDSNQVTLKCSGNPKILQVQKRIE